jgi:hypothetical protein
MTVWKEPAEVATTEALGAGPAFPTSGVIDGVTLKAGHRVLVKDQLTSTENGYYKVVAGIPPTLMATGDIIEAEDAIRVSHGDRNGHTAWTLIDVTKRLFVRQDVSHYSLKSIDELKHLWQVLPNATATVACYAEQGDRGGGDFTFIGVPERARVMNATPESKLIKTVGDVDGVVTITTTTPHDLGQLDNLTTTYISGVTGLANEAYAVRVIDTDTLTINANTPISGTSLAAGAQIQYVKLVTAGPHGRATGQRISVAGVMALGGAVDICKATADIYKIIDLSGVIDEKTLSIPIGTTGGTYMPGQSAVIGDGGLTVPATDPRGISGGLWQRLRSDHFDVRWFGAKSNWNGTTVSDGRANFATDDGTANLAAFNAALATMAAGGRLSGKLVADGHFYLSDTLVLTQTVAIEGTSQNEPVRGDPTITTRCLPGTMLVFPQGVTGIRIRSGDRLDNPTKTVGELFPPTGEKTALHNLTVYCKDLRTQAETRECLDEEDECVPEGVCNHGVHASVTVRLENVTVENFAHDGIHIVGAECRKPLFDADGNPVLDADGNQVQLYDGNAALSYVENCFVGDCGRDGFHFRGGGAATCVVSRCTASKSGRYGFFDKTRMNTYIGCHAEGNKVEYHTEGSTPPPDPSYNSSVFVGCYAEGNGDRCELYGDVTVIGGAIGDTNTIKNSTAFILEHGVASRAPIVYHNDKGPVVTRIEIGQNDGDGGVLNFYLPIGDSNLFHYAAERGWWGLRNVDVTNFWFPTTIARPRRRVPTFSQGIFYGSPSALGDAGASKALTNHIAMTAIPSTDTWEKGDVVWNSAPTPGGPIAWVCTAAGTNGELLGLTGNVDVLDPTKVVVNHVPDNLMQWAYIKIAASAKIFQIINDPTHSVPPNTLMLDTAATPGATGAIIFQPATFSTVGVVENVGNSTSYLVDTLLAVMDRYVTVTETGKTITLPASPVDGQTHSIKSQAGTALRAGVTTTVKTAVEDFGPPMLKLKIDGQESVTLAPSENGTFRYSAATGEWEIR